MKECVLNLNLNQIEKGKKAIIVSIDSKTNDREEDPALSGLHL